MSMVSGKRKNHFAKKVRYLVLFCSIGIIVTVNLPHVLAASNADAKSVFAERCSICHGENGTADTPLGQSLKAKNLHSAEVQKLSDQKIASVIRGGNGNMPSFKGILSDNQIRHMVAYVRTLAKASKKQARTQTFN